jgi:hypothetical protein
MPNYVAAHAGVKSLFTHRPVWLPNLRVGSLVPPGEEIYLFVKDAIEDLMAN